MQRFDLAGVFVSLVAFGAAACGDATHTGLDAHGDVARDAGTHDTSMDSSAPLNRGPMPPMATATFLPSTASILNPERGWMNGDGIDLRGSDTFSTLRSDGFTLAYAKLMLEDFREAPLTDAVLDAIRAGLARVRAGRFKVVLRVVYNDPNTYPCLDPSPTGLCDDAPLAIVLQHIHQLGPIFRENADVIAVVQAGFIGLWGEWHSSINGLDSVTNRQQILAALLSEVPPSRMIQVRTPMAKSDFGFATPLATAQAFDGSDQARLGHQDDCFLSEATDYGTFPTPTWQDYVATDSSFVPTGGETCSSFPTRSACAPAMTIMAQLHWSFLNRLYNPDIVNGWQTETPPCFTTIEQRLGYRFVVLDAAWSEAVRPGGVLALHVRLRNDGYAALFNARPVFLVLDDGTNRQTARISGADPRRWLPGSDIIIDASFRVPATTPTGNYRLALWLPDDATALRAIPEYSIQLASDGVWRAATGDNVLTDSLRVDPSVGGPVDPSATMFVELP